MYSNGVRLDGVPSIQQQRVERPSISRANPSSPPTSKSVNVTRVSSILDLKAAHLKDMIQKMGFDAFLKTYNPSMNDELTRKIVEKIRNN